MYDMFPNTIHKKIAIIKDSNLTAGVHWPECFRLHQMTNPFGKTDDLFQLSTQCVNIAVITLL